MFRHTMVKLFVVLLALTMLASCAPAAVAPTTAPAGGTNPTSAPAASEPTAVTMNVLPTAAAAEPTSAPAATGKKFKVALVIGLLGDKSFNDSAARGIQFVNDKFSDVETKIIENQDVGEQQLAARAMAQQGFDLVITIGYGSADWTDQIASEFPDTHFAIIDAELKQPNGTGLTFKEHEGSFTVGMIAAMLTTTKKVGYVGGMDVPLLRRFETGYIEGVKYVDPTIEVVSGWVGDFNDPNKGKELALTQYTEGVDIIYAAAGKSGEGVLQASKEKNLFSIGVDSDQDYMQPGHVITSMLKRVDLAVYETVRELRDGTLKGGTQSFGLKEGMVGSTFLYNETPVFFDSGPAEMVTKIKSDVLPALTAATDKIKNGEMCVDDFMKVFPCTNPAPEGGMGK
ncbi:MAG: BMP family ABC transporter substrate-binding protein [Chloroflexi bacterium]|nr:BMP family ABC transporter substrate-binding protein [Chloroflexota bacterium]